VQAANEGAADSSARNAAGLEVNELAQELDRISTSTKYGSNVLLNGSFAGTFQVGAGTSDTLAVSITQSFNSVALGVGFTTAVFTSAGSASTALASIDAAISKVSDERAKLGAKQNRFEHTIANLNVAVENLAASESRIRDTDMANEMVSFTRAQILSQAGTAMLAQANSAPQGVLQLLRG
jgi:flagellin